MGTGYSGVDNPLFYLNNVKMLFGDAKQSMDSISTCLEVGCFRLQKSLFFFWKQRLKDA